MARDTLTPMCLPSIDGALAVPSRRRRSQARVPVDLPCQRELAGMIDVHCHDAVTTNEHAEIDTWLAATDTNDIETLVVGDRVVAIHGYRNNPLVLSGTAARHGDLTGELDSAHLIMRRATKFRAVIAPERRSVNTSWRVQQRRSDR